MNVFDPVPTALDWKQQCRHAELKFALLQKQYEQLIARADQLIELAGVIPVTEEVYRQLYLYKSRELKLNRYKPVEVSLAVARSLGIIDDTAKQAESFPKSSGIDIESDPMIS